MKVILYILCFFSVIISKQYKKVIVYEIIASIPIIHSKNLDCLIDNIVKTILINENKMDAFFIIPLCF